MEEAPPTGPGSPERKSGRLAGISIGSAKWGKHMLPLGEVFFPLVPSHCVYVRDAGTPRGCGNRIPERGTAA